MIATLEELSEDSFNITIDNGDSLKITANRRKAELILGDINETINEPGFTNPIMSKRIQGISVSSHDDDGMEIGEQLLWFDQYK